MGWSVGCVVMLVLVLVVVGLAAQQGDGPE